MTLHLNYRDVARANIEQFDRLGGFHGYYDCLYHYFDHAPDTETEEIPTDFACAIGICDVNNELEEWNDDSVSMLIERGHITTDNEEKLILIQRLHDYCASGGNHESFAHWVNHNAITKINIPDYMNLQSPNDLTPKVYKEIMAKIASE